MSFFGQLSASSDWNAAASQFNQKAFNVGTTKRSVHPTPNKRAYDINNHVSQGMSLADVDRFRRLNIII